MRGRVGDGVGGVLLGLAKWAGYAVGWVTEWERYSLGWGSSHGVAAISSRIHKVQQNIAEASLSIHFSPFCDPRSLEL